jgi:lactoylglutathione lyase
MFTNQIKIMLYVDNVEESAAFWQSVGFHEFERQEMDGTLIVEIGLSATAESRLVLYDRTFIEKHSPEVALNSPIDLCFLVTILCLCIKRCRNWELRWEI